MCVLAFRVEVWSQTPVGLAKQSPRSISSGRRAHLSSGDEPDPTLELRRSQHEEDEMPAVMGLTLIVDPTKRRPTPQSFGAR
jgi:hypothetical protein